MPPQEPDNPAITYAYTGQGAQYGYKWDSSGAKEFAKTLQDVKKGAKELCDQFNCFDKALPKVDKVLKRIEDFAEKAKRGNYVALFQQLGGAVGGMGGGAGSASYTLPMGGVTATPGFAGNPTIGGVPATQPSNAAVTHQAGSALRAFGRRVGAVGGALGTLAGGAEGLLTASMQRYIPADVLQNRLVVTSGGAFTRQQAERVTRMGFGAGDPDRFAAIYQGMATHGLSMFRDDRRRSSWEEMMRRSERITGMPAAQIAGVEAEFASPRMLRMLMSRGMTTSRQLGTGAVTPTPQVALSVLNRFIPNAANMDPTLLQRVIETGRTPGAPLQWSLAQMGLSPEAQNYVLRVGEAQVAGGGRLGGPLAPEAAMVRAGVGETVEQEMRVWTRAMDNAFQEVGDTVRDPFLRNIRVMGNALNRITNELDTASEEWRRIIGEGIAGLGQVGGVASGLTSALGGLLSTIGGFLLGRAGRRVAVRTAVAAGARAAAPWVARGAAAVAGTAAAPFVAAAATTVGLAYVSSRPDEYTEGNLEAARNRRRQGHAPRDEYEEAWEDISSGTPHPMSGESPRPVGGDSEGGKYSVAAPPHSSRGNPTAKALHALLGSIPHRAYPDIGRKKRTRSGGLSFHTTGHALDIFEPTGKRATPTQDEPTLAAIYRHLKPLKDRGVLDELIYGGPSGGGWRTKGNRDDHLDHVHAAASESSLAKAGNLDELMRGTGRSGTSSAASITTQRRVRPYAQARRTERAGGRVRRRVTPAGMMGRGSSGGTISAGVTPSGATAPDTSGVTGGGGAPGANKTLGKQLAAAYGWTGDEWAALERLWDKESGWRHTADNPTSSAYGIPQALIAMHNMPAGYYESKTGSGARTQGHGGDPRVQIEWGLNYIKGRYGSPSKALAFHNRNNYYDSERAYESYGGGDSIGPAGGGTIELETPAPTSTRPIGAARTIAPRRGGASGGNNYNLTVRIEKATDEEAERFARKVVALVETKQRDAVIGAT